MGAAGKKGKSQNKAREVSGRQKEIASEPHSILVSVKFDEIH